MSLLINIDVPDLARGIAFYVQAFDLEIGRLIGDAGVELLGFPVPLYLLERPAWTSAAASSGTVRDYARHWTPVHLDVVVADVRTARDRAVAAGAVVEREIATAAWGSIVGLADPFGHGLCLIEFHGRGYDEIA